MAHLNQNIIAISRADNSRDGKSNVDLPVPAAIYTKASAGCPKLGFS